MSNKRYANEPLDLQENKRLLNSEVSKLALNTVKAIQEFEEYQMINFGKISYKDYTINTLFGATRLIKEDH